MKKQIILPLLAVVGLCVFLSSCAAPLSSPGGSFTEVVFFNPTGPITLTNCVGKYYGCFKMTNSAGSTWLTPPTNVTGGTFSDLTSLGSNVNYSLLVSELANMNIHWCTNNSPDLTFPALNTTRYSFYFYINTPTNEVPITNPICLQLTWATNNQSEIKNQANQ
jgi:hypothetical protein